MAGLLLFAQRVTLDDFQSRSNTPHVLSVLFISVASGVSKDWCFTCEFEGLILRMNEGKSPISPIGIVSQLRNIGRQLGNGKEEDAHEFLR